MEIPFAQPRSGDYNSRFPVCGCAHSPSLSLKGQKETSEVCFAARVERGKERKKRRPSALLLISIFRYFLVFALCSSARVASEISLGASTPNTFENDRMAPLEELKAEKSGRKAMRSRVLQKRPYRHTSFVARHLRRASRSSLASSLRSRKTSSAEVPAFSAIPCSCLHKYF